MNSHASYVSTCYSFIHSILEEDIYQVGNLAFDGCPIPSFDENLLIDICNDVIKIFEKEENIIEIEGDAIVVGDIHGSFHDLLRIIQYVEKCNTKVIFLGDYVDRGNFSLECITLLFSLKILKPNTYYLLRGNHEFDEMASHYGFKREIMNYHNPNQDIQIETDQNKPKIADETHINFDIDDKDKIGISNSSDSYFSNYINMNCYKYTEKLYDAFLKAFSYLPISAIINKTSICLHGGLSPHLDTIEKIQTHIKRPISNFDENILLSDIIWGDPSAKLTQMYGDNPRGRGKLFSGPVVVNFLKNNNLKRLIRGHECVSDGYDEIFNKKCITVFSASSYGCDMGNSSGILKLFLKNDQIEPVTFSPLHRLKKCDTSYYKVQPFEVKKMTSPLPRIHNYMSGPLLSFAHISNSCSESLNCHYHTSRKGASTSREDAEKKMQFCQSQKLLKVPQTSPKKKKLRSSCVMNAPIILTPQIPKNMHQEV